MARIDIANGLVPPLAFAGVGIGASVLGGALDSRIPAGMTNPLTATGSTFAAFTPAVATIGAGGIVLNQFRKINL